MTPEAKDEPYFIIHPAMMGLFLFGSYTAALLLYIFAFISQSHKLPAVRKFFVLSCVNMSSELRGAQNIYYPAFVLLFWDGLAAIMGLVWGLLLFKGDVGLGYLTVFNIWYCFRFLGQCQHLITALIAIIFVQNPQLGDPLRGMRKFLDVLPVILVLLSAKLNENIMIGLDFYNFLLVLGILVSFCQTTLSPMANQRKPITLLSVLFFLFCCLPNMLLRLLLLDFDRNRKYLTLSGAVLLFTNFYGIMNALLFRLVLKVEVDDRRDNNHYECAVRNVA